MIIVISNRNIAHPNAKDETVFGNKLSDSPDELRVATAAYNETSKKWSVALQKENAKPDAAPPSKLIFDKMMSQMKKGKTSKKWVFFVHGFNQSFEKNLKKCYALEKIYGVNVIAFSWPSNPGGLPVGEYRRARKNALASVAGLDRTIGKLATYLSERPFDPDCDVHLSFMSYSLGNYLFENFVRSPAHFDGKTKIFENIVLCQADANSEGHEEWVEKLKFCKRVYVTINENDKVLDTSDIINPDRIGNTAKNLDAEGVVYFDFTDGKNVGKTHGVFYAFNCPDLKCKPLKNKNPVITKIFSRILTGRRAESIDGVVYNPRTNAHELVSKE